MQVHYKKISADLETPVSAYLKVATGYAQSFLLESVEGGERLPDILLLEWVQMGALWHGAQPSPSRGVFPKPPNPAP